MRRSRRIDLNVGWAESPDESDIVVIGDRAVPRLIEVTFPGAGGQPRCEFVIDSSSGVPRCVRLTLEASDVGPEIRTTDVRSIELANWVEAIVPLFSGTAEYRPEGLHIAFEDGENTEAELRTVVQQLRRAKRADRRRFDDEFLRRVAQTYESDPVRPAEAVELAFDVSPRTAYRYIRMARDRGLLAEKEA